MLQPRLSPHALRAALAAVALGCAFGASADDPPRPSGAEEDPQASGPNGDGPEGTTWVDAGHEMVEDVIGTVLRLDRFFSDERELDPLRERSFVRWRNDVHATQDDSFEYVTTLRASLRFPGLSRWWRDRLRLVIEGESDDAPEALFPPEQGAAATPPRVIEDAAAELRYGLVRRLGLDADVGAGVMLRLPVGAIGRARVRYARPIGPHALARAALTGFWRTDLRLGTTGDLELQRQLGRNSVLRLGNSATINEQESARGFQWGSELALLRAIGSRSAVSVAAGLRGVTRPDPRVEEYRAYVRYRRDLLRRWFFVELEPEVAWPVEPDGDLRRVLGVIVRAEVQFHGNGVSVDGAKASGRRTPGSATRRAVPTEDPADPEPRDPE